MNNPELLGNAILFYVVDIVFEATLFSLMLYGGAGFSDGFVRSVNILINLVVPCFLDNYEHYFTVVSISWLSVCMLLLFNLLLFQRYSRRSK